MKKYLLIPAIMLVAIGCNKANNTSKTPTGSVQGTQTNAVTNTPNTSSSSFNNIFDSFKAADSTGVQQHINKPTPPPPQPKLNTGNTLTNPIQNTQKSDIARGIEEMQKYAASQGLLLQAKNGGPCTEATVSDANPCILVDPRQQAGQLAQQLAQQSAQQAAQQAAYQAKVQKISYYKKTIDSLLTQYQSANQNDRVYIKAQIDAVNIQWQNCVDYDVCP